MARALLSALGGLRAHQEWIDVIGNNLANASTPGFKSSRALFSSILAQTLREGSPPSNTLGGSNPVQIGLGTTMRMVDRDVSQGTLNFTGRTFDLAMRGEGFFAVTDGLRSLYTRVGTFGLDADSNMVDLRTGFRVLDGTGKSFKIDTNASVPPKPTTQVMLAGNLPANVGGPISEVLSTTNPLYEGQPANTLGTAVAAGGAFTGLTPSTTYSMSITMNGSTAQSVSVTSDATGQILMSDVVNEINSTVPNVVAQDVGGQLQLTSTLTGDASTILVTPSQTGNDLVSVLGLSTSLKVGSQSVATSSTSINSLPANTKDYVAGDVLQISGVDADGTVVDADFVFGTGVGQNGTTIGELVAFVGAQYPQSTVEFDAATGEISVTSNTPGESDMALVVTDAPTNTGAANWAANSFAVETQGTGPDTFQTSIQVYDQAGVGHVVNFTLERIDGKNWSMKTSLTGAGDTVLSGGAATISFGDDGNILGIGNSSVTVQFDGQSPQTFALSFAGDSASQGVTQFGGANSLVADFQDGYPAGSLANLSVNNDGSITGFYSNGQTFDLGQFGIASFPNVLGLSDVGDGFYAETGNSGQLRLGSADFAGVGEVVGGALEESNVITAEEFVRLIQAQRGFQANARIISIQDQMLEEAVNIV
ncbi:MAG: flagellar hook-basal body complex protein [Planctomycetota bacterium]